MKNLMIYINPRHDFDDEGKIAVKIQIDSSLDLGWKREDMMLITNFPYQYNGVKSIVLNDDIYVEWFPQSTKMSAIVNLIERGLINDQELYWAHDLDAYQMDVINESELELGPADLALTDRGLDLKWYMCCYFFRGSAQDILQRLKEIIDQYQVDEESALMALTTNNPRWLNQAPTEVIEGIENLPQRIKKLNISYAYWPDDLSQTYGIVAKPIKVLHFHFSFDLLLDSAMYSKNSLHQPLLSERLIKIFHQHGVKGTRLKKMKNLMIYLSPAEKFQPESESLVEQQIENSFKLGWPVEDLMLVTNFPYEYRGVKAMVIENHDQAPIAGIVFRLLNEGLVKEAQLWWFHDLEIFQTQPLESSRIELDDTTAGFINTDNFFFRKGADKIFEWIRNRAQRLGSDEARAFGSLTAENYRNIEVLYKQLKLDKPI